MVRSKVSILLLVIFGDLRHEWAVILQVILLEKGRDILGVVLVYGGRLLLWRYPLHGS